MSDQRDVKNGTQAGASTPPGTMDAAILHAPGDVRMERMAVPQPGDGEALIKLRASGICGSDLMEWYVRQKAPFVFGHEPAGDVVQLGAGVTNLRVGDRVALHHHAPCLECDVCLRGDYVHCDVWRKNALRPGGMAEYAVIDANAVRHDTLVLPDSVSYEAATLVEPAACVIKALRRAGLRGGDRVLVIGLGFTGQLFGLLARAEGAATVAGIDSVDMRLTMAGKHWADTVYRLGSGGGSESGEPPAGAFDLVVVTPGSAAAIRAGITATRNGGTTLLFAPTAPGEDVPFPVHELFFREINIVTSYSATPPEMRTALAHVVAGTLPKSVLVTHRYSLHETGEAYRKALDVNEALKVIVTM